MILDALKPRRRKLEKDIKEGNFRRKERHYGAFSRSFTLPTTVDPDKIDANYTVRGRSRLTLRKNRSLWEMKESHSGITPLAQRHAVFFVPALARGQSECFCISQDNHPSHFYVVESKS